MPTSNSSGTWPFDRAGEENLSRDEAAARSELITVQRYEVDVDLSAAAAQGARTYPVRTRIEFSLDNGAMAGQAETFLDYLGDSVFSVTLNGESLDPERHVGSARILLPGLREENVVEIVSQSVYSRSGEGLHRFVDPADGGVYLYSQYEPADCRRVFPVFEQPDLKARFRFSLTGPQSWQLRSNAPEESRHQLPGLAEGLEEDGIGLVRVCFAETERMSSYITALLAGPYYAAEGEWSGSTPSGEQVEVPLTLLCRASMAEHFDVEALLELTGAGLDFFHTEFDLAYPWGKYDQVFVPEYNLGAMENPGLVTFTEAYVFDAAATDAQYETRANTLMHEMAHMWFGDLVTMRWWDDLWLKESFADYMGSLAVDEATGWTTSWISFASARKAWAYVQDQLPTTHPIVADIEDLEAADQNFDGITYAKGASVLKQLGAYAGRAAFREASRRYFRRHAFGNATLQDFLGILEEVTGKDMQGWAQAWLQTAGLPVIAVETGTGAEGEALSVRESGEDPATGDPVSRPHVIEVGLHCLDAESGVLTRDATAPVTIRREDSGAALEVPGLRDEARTRLILPNEQDLTYAKLTLDPQSVAAVLTHPVDDPLARATVWASLWSMVRDGELSARRFLEAVMDLGLRIPEITVVQALLRQTDRALRLFAPAGEREDLQRRFSARLAEFLNEADAAPGLGDHQRAAARTLASLSRRSGSQLHLLAELLDGDGPELGITSLELDEELRWAFLQALAAHGRVSAQQLDAELARNTTARGRIAHRLASAARPEKRVKEDAFSQAVSGADEAGQELSNDHLSATVEGFMVDATEHARLIAPYLSVYFEAVEEVWERMSQGQATRVIGGLFPSAQDLAPGQSPEDHPVARQSRRWLEEHFDAPAALRRIILEEQDHLMRSLRAQEAASCPET